VGSFSERDQAGLLGFLLGGRDLRVALSRVILIDIRPSDTGAR
jgi:hypothetical protein